MYQQRHLQQVLPHNNPIIHAFHSSQANHLSLGFNASNHWHHLRFVNGGRMKGFHEALGAHTFKSISLTFIHVSPFRALCAISSHSCCHPQYLFQSFISTCIHQHIPLVQYIHRCAILYQDTQSHAPSDIHWLYSIFYSSPYHIPFSLSMCRVGVIDPLSLFVPHAVVTFSYRRIRISRLHLGRQSFLRFQRINTPTTIRTINLSISVNIA